MLYYRVKPQYDNYIRYYERPNHTLKENGILVANELYTEKERAKIMNGDWFFEKVNINKNKTYFFFGVRFSQEKGE